MPTAVVVGLYPVFEAVEPCFLVELRISEGSGVFSVAAITQPIADIPRDNWQVPYLERILSADGQTILTREFEAEDQPELWCGNFRLVFFFHYLDLNAPLFTPFGTLRLPEPSERPARLSELKYELP